MSKVVVPIGGAPTGVLDATDEYVIKPENSGPKLNTADWPLLLKNYVCGLAGVRLQKWLANELNWTGQASRALLALYAHPARLLAAEA